MHFVRRPIFVKTNKSDIGRPSFFVQDAAISSPGVRHFHFYLAGFSLQMLSLHCKRKELCQKCMAPRHVKSEFRGSAQLGPSDLYGITHWNDPACGRPCRLYLAADLRVHAGPFMKQIPVTGRTQIPLWFSGQQRTWPRRGEGPMLPAEGHSAGQEQGRLCVVTSSKTLRRRQQSRVRTSRRGQFLNWRVYHA